MLPMNIGPLESGFEGYLRSTRRLEESARVISSAGITTSYEEELKRVESPAYVVERGTVELDDGIVAMKRAKVEASANIDVMKSEKERFSDLIDLLSKDTAFLTNVAFGSPR
jgi:hypothetical protein